MKAAKAANSGLAGQPPQGRGRHSHARVFPMPGKDANSQALNFHATASQVYVDNSSSVADPMGLFGNNNASEMRINPAGAHAAVPNGARNNRQGQNLNDMLADLGSSRADYN